MQDNLIQNIKDYNQALRKKKEEVQRTEVEIRMLEESIAKKCEELTQDLGVTVDSSNVQQVYAEYRQRLEVQLNQGLSVLNNIANKQMTNTQQPQQNQMIQNQEFAQSNNFYGGSIQNTGQAVNNQSFVQHAANQNNVNQMQKQAQASVQQQVNPVNTLNQVISDFTFDSIPEQSVNTFADGTIFDENIKLF